VGMTDLVCLVTQGSEAESSEKIVRLLGGI